MAKQLAIEWAEIYLLAACWLLAFGAGCFGVLASRVGHSLPGVVTMAGWAGICGTASAIGVVLLGYENGSGLAQIGSALIVGLIVGYRGASWTAAKLGAIADKLPIGGDADKRRPDA